MDISFDFDTIKEFALGSVGKCFKITGNNEYCSDFFMVKKAYIENNRLETVLWKVTYYTLYNHQNSDDDFDFSMRQQIEALTWRTSDGKLYKGGLDLTRIEEANPSDLRKMLVKTIDSIDGEVSNINIR